MFNLQQTVSQSSI